MFWGWVLNLLKKDSALFLVTDDSLPDASSQLYFSPGSSPLILYFPNFIFNLLGNCLVNFL